jgi:hypothetical protein
MASHPAGENNKAERQVRSSGGGVNVELTGYPISQTSLRIEKRKSLQVHTAAELGSVRVPFMKP